MGAHTADPRGAQELDRALEAACRAQPAEGAEAGFDRRQRAILAISALAVFMSLLDATIVNVAFPAIHRSFGHVPLTDLSWVLNAYNVVVAALLVPAGRLVDRVGRRRGFFTGLLVFLAGSALCGVAPSASVLIGARVLQAAGAAMLVPASLGVLLASVPPEQRARVTSAWTATGVVAAAAGPSLGGVLVQEVGWRWVFFVNLALALALLRAPRILSESREPDGGMPDLAGTGLLAIAVGLFALGIVKAPDWGWGSLPDMVSLLAGGGLLVTVVHRCHHHPVPVIEPELLKLRSFGRANYALLVFSGGVYALLLANVLFLTEVWHYSILRAGFAVTPGPIAAALAAAAGGRVSERLSPRAAAIPGMIGFACACLGYRGVGPAPAYLTHWLPAQVPSGLAIGFTISALSTASVADLPSARLATGSAVTASFRQIGAVIGIAGVIAISAHATPLTAMHAFRLCWLLMAAASVAAIVPALGLAVRSGVATVVGPVPQTGPTPRTITGFARRELRIYGSTVSYQIAGQGPPVLLVHGLLDDSATWRRVAPQLARSYTVVVPDLPGHGLSAAAANGDYSPGGHAVVLRELLDRLDYGRVALVGHSIGGAIAMSFASQNPERVARIALIAPGGFGREVHRLLRAGSLPGAGALLALLTSTPARAMLGLLVRATGRLGLARVTVAGQLLAAILAQLAPRSAREAFLRTTASVIMRSGQRASAVPMMDLWRRYPMLVLWGTADRIIPARHSLVIAEEHAAAEVVLMERTGHHPHLTRSRLTGDRLGRFLDAGPRTGPLPSRPGRAALRTAV